MVYAANPLGCADEAMSAAFWARRTNSAANIFIAATVPHHGLTIASCYMREHQLAMCRS
jgi:hypothetical protein